MVIYRPTTPLEAVKLRKTHPDSLYLAGGTEDLRLNGAAKEDSVLIDINGLGLDRIEETPDGMLKIGAMVTLQRILECDKVPSLLKDACRLCASFERRNAATIGGNVGSRRDDSYLIAALVASDVSFWSVTPHGEEFKKVSDYAQSQCKRLIVYFLIDPKRTGTIKRFGLTSASHAAVIAAESEGRYALSVKGSSLAVGNSKDIWKDIFYQDDLVTGSAAYKKYLASVAFEGGKS